ncbi:MAG TPA: SdpI family protein [Polyangiaceae bacterium]|nr:SdpI family protein [Polyangiaceae bacterium]
MSVRTTLPRSLTPLDALTLGLLAGTFVCTVFVYARLPNPMPTHFGLDGRPNGWMPRAIGAWVAPVVATVACALVRFGGPLLPGDWRVRLESSPRRALAAATAALLTAVHVMGLRAALGPTHRMGHVVWVALGVFFVALGQVLPRTRRNPFVGVRTTWTLTSDENWARTHRVAAYTFTVGGVMASAAGFFDAPALAMASILAAAVAPALWSWWLARHDAQQG